MEQHERTYCAGCGTYRFKPAGALCWHCKPAAEKAAIMAANARQGEAAPAARPAGTLEVAGHIVTAPGFTAASFDRAVHRAFCEGLRIGPTATPGTFLVNNPTHATAYAATHETCTCPAGTAGRACKHRARIAFELDLCEGRYLPAPAIIGEAA